MKNHERFRNIGYDDFRAMSRDKSLSRHEKIGFPDSFREGKARAILRDIAGKIPALNRRGGTVADIGCGCGELVLETAAHCAKKNQQLILMDSADMLAQIPDMPHMVKIGGRFPSETEAKAPPASCDAVIVYSVLHYVFCRKLRIFIYGCGVGNVGARRALVAGRYS